MSIDPKKVKKILGKNILADGFDPNIDLDKSHGSWLVDHRDGKENGVALDVVNQTLVGSQHVPYIFEDYCSVDDAFSLGQDHETHQNDIRLNQS